MQPTLQKSPFPFQQHSNTPPLFFFFPKQFNSKKSHLEIKEFYSAEIFAGLKK
jgi:hypothetical protein